MTATLPEGYNLDQDEDGTWVLVPPEQVTIFSTPGEGWMVTGDFMEGRDWNDKQDVVAACLDYLNVVAASLDYLED